MGSAKKEFPISDGGKFLYSEGDSCSFDATVMGTKRGILFAAKRAQISNMEWLITL